MIKRVPSIDLFGVYCRHICLKFYEKIYGEYEKMLFKMIGEYGSPSRVSIHYVYAKELYQVDNIEYSHTLSYYMKNKKVKVFMREAKGEKIIKRFADIIPCHSQRSEDRRSLDMAYQRSIGPIDKKRKLHFCDYFE
jgi:hypothetical protein